VPNIATPRNLKILAGTVRPDREAVDAPEFDSVAEFPSAPQHLTVDGSDLWSKVGPQLVNAGVLQVVDLAPLEQLCFAWQSFRKKAKADMEVTASEHQALRGLFAEFGMTPAARRRVMSSGETKPNNRFSANKRSA
jgi:phage terminase small subunit